MLKLKWSLAAFLALAIAQSATGAVARTYDVGSPDDVQVVVRYGDLDLATPQGAQALRVRIDRAAMRVKGDVDPRDLRGMAELRKARAAALDAANAIIEARRGTAYAEIAAAQDKLGL
jgi:UrcA family protein